MSKLITAKEAFALSKPLVNSNQSLDRYIEHINQQIRWAISKHKLRVGVAIYDCNDNLASTLFRVFLEAGYSVRYKMARENVACFEISWGES